MVYILQANLRDFLTRAQPGQPHTIQSTCVLQKLHAKFSYYMIVSPSENVVLKLLAGMTTGRVVLASQFEELYTMTYSATTVRNMEVLKKLAVLAGPTYAAV